MSDMPVWRGMDEVVFVNQVLILLAEVGFRLSSFSPSI